MAESYDLILKGGTVVNHDGVDWDAVEEAWTTYYASIFNPARLKPKAMQEAIARAQRDMGAG